MTAAEVSIVALKIEQLHGRSCAWPQKPSCPFPFPFPFPLPLSASFHFPFPFPSERIRIQGHETATVATRSNPRPNQEQPREGSQQPETAGKTDSTPTPSATECCAAAPAMQTQCLTIPFPSRYTSPAGNSSVIRKYVVKLP